MEDLLTSDEISHDSESAIILLLISFAFVIIFGLISIKESVDTKKKHLKNFIKINYAMVESEFTKEDQKLIEITYFNTVKNKSVEKMKDRIDSTKKIRNREKKVSFAFC